MLEYRTGDDAVREFSQVQHYLKKATDRPNANWTLEMIFDGLKQDQLQLWTDDGAACVTAMYDDHCLILCCGGENMSRWIDDIEIIERWARYNNKPEMRIYGRKGWARVLGYEIAGTGYGTTFLRKIL